MPTASSLLQLFRPGCHTAADGQELTFTEAHLAASAKAYDPALHEAPLVIGHPRHDLPAYGWVKSLAFSAGHLEAEPHQVDASFAELVRSGRYKKRSASFYKPEAKENPVPGVYYLRHVGFLGAAPPAIKGLREAAFDGADEASVVFVEFGEGVSGWSVAAALRGVRDLLIAKFGLADVTAALPDYLIGNLEADAAREAAATSPAYGERPTSVVPAGSHPPPAEPALPAAMPSTETLPMTTPTTPTADQLAAQAADLKAREAAIAAREAAAAKSENASFLEGLIGGGKLLPVYKDGLLNFMGGLSSSVSIDFTENGQAKQLSQLAWFKDVFLAGQPKVVEFNESAGAEKGASTTVDFQAPPGSDVDADAAELHNKALAWQRQNPGTEYIAAYRAVGGK